ncbi:MAG TPA: UbiA family prenyltransferase [Candidatus Dormibacteraeota bacterium]|nr:UbiA family prenyltransferase [Candidatus Dormibacteraeota bacterium]
MRRLAQATWLLLKCSHPEPVFTVTAIVTVLAVSAGRGPGRVTLMALAVFTGQLFVGWTNDFLDAKLDAAANREDKPVSGGRVPRDRVGTAAAVAGVLTIPLSLLVGLGAGLAHLAAVASATSYNLGLKRTPFSILAYAIAFGLIPAFVTLAPPNSHAPALWATAAGALLGGGAHFTQTLPDIEGDRRAGLRGLPHVLGRRASAFAGPILMAGSAVCVALGPAHVRPLVYAGTGLALILLAVILVVSALDRARLAFRLTLLTAAVVVATVLSAGVYF